MNVENHEIKNIGYYPPPKYLICVHEFFNFSLNVNFMLNQLDVFILRSFNVPQQNLRPI